MISEIKENTQFTDKESVNDQPFNIDKYIIIKFNKKNPGENMEVAYLYEKNKDCYVERPYLGIWKLSREIFDKINNLIIKGRGL